MTKVKGAQSKGKATDHEKEWNQGRIEEIHRLVVRSGVS